MADLAARLTYPQQLEVRRIERSAGVIAGSVALTVEDGTEVLTFDIQTEPSVETPKADIHDVERIHFVYRKGRRFGMTAPANVLCDRADFPKNIGHLCAGEPGCVAAPCLAIGGIQPLYERAGIEAIMSRLRDFLRDAKTGTLMAEGWEPVPFGIDQKLRHGELEPRFFQEHALANPEAGSAVGVAINYELDEGRYAVVFPQVLEARDVSEAIAFRNGESGKRHGIPWVFFMVRPKQDRD